MLIRGIPSSLLLLSLLTLAACTEPTDAPQPGPDTTAALTTFQPKSGFPGTTMAIAGSGFGGDVGQVTVLFNGRDTARVLGVAPGLIRVAVPFGEGEESIQVWVRGAKVGEFPDRFTISTIRDVAYDTVQIALDSTTVGYSVVDPDGTSRSEARTYRFATSFVSALTPRRVNSGVLGISSLETSAARRSQMSLKLVLGETPGRFSSVEIGGVDTTIAPAGQGESTVSSVLTAIKLKDVPYALDERGRILIRIPAAQRAAAIEYLISSETSTRLRGTDVLGTSSANLTDIRGHAPGSTWSITVAPRP